MDGTAAVSGTTREIFQEPSSFWLKKGSKSRGIKITGGRSIIFQHQDGDHLCSMLSTTTSLEDDVGQGAAELSSIELSLRTSKP
jgi:hypothetical protein